MTIKNLYPKARPQTIYNVINGRPELPAASTFSRASEATYVDAAGIVQTAAVDEPRFNHDPETGEFLGLLLEGQGKNGVRYSDTATYASPSSGVQNDSGYIYTFEPNSPSGGQYLRMEKLQTHTSQAWALAIDYSGLAYPQNTKCIVSFWVRSPNVTQFSLRNPDVDGVLVDVTPEWRRVYAGFRYGAQSMSLPFLRIDRAGDLPVGSVIDICNVQAEILPSGSDWTNVGPRDASSYFANSGGTGTFSSRAADTFSLTSSNNFDGGFSLLLDSDTTTDDYFYKIKAAGTTIAELNNDNGTLDWVINGTSAATSGDYPQVGAIQPGRVRTVSSFGAADGTTQLNYLYTEGLSFPTNAIVATGADEVEFGPGQTLKAVYLWNGQLSNIEAVSVIKGEYNIVPNEPIKADSYSFVYNTDPTNIGETSITLPYIVPTVSMRVYWGDGSNDAYEQGVTPSHTYPYPGQYRIQIEADDGFDAVRLADVNNSIYRVDQWAPQHRVGAAGGGFTGDDLANLLTYQSTLKVIPPFKYTGLTDLSNAFRNCQKVEADTVDWVPTNLQTVSNLSKTFYSTWETADDKTALTNFPQIQTSSVLTNLTYVFAKSNISSFVNNTPFTNTSNVTSFSNAFRGCNLTDLQVDTSSATALDSAFADNPWVTSPYFIANNCTNFTSIFEDCNLMVSLNPGIQNSTFSSGEIFDYAWESCASLTSFPSLDYSSATNMRQTWKGCETMTTWGAPSTTDSFSQVSSFVATWQNCLLLQNMPLINTSGIPENGDLGMDSVWQNCAALTSFPLIDTSNCKTLQTCWSGCSSLTSFPAIDTSSCKEFTYSWRNCPGLTSFPLLDFSAAEVLSNTWMDCSGLTSFPQIDTSSVTNVGATWRYCSALTAFPLLDFSSAEQFYRAWDGCTLLEDFPANSFDSTGTLESYAFDQAWQNCALTTDSIENILVSLDTNGASNIELGIDGGTNAAKSTWTAAANTAYTNLINKGWTITFNA